MGLNEQMGDAERDGRREDAEAERDPEGYDGEDAHLAGELAAGQESHGAGSSHVRPRAPGDLSGHGRCAT